MSQVNNFNFTDEELAVATDKHFILVKHDVMRKVSALFGELEREMKKDIAPLDPGNTGANFSAGKIFRGENYERFPYVLLDYPRIFNTRTVFAFRTMFWWGNEFSFTLHLQGEAMDRFRERLKENLPNTSMPGTYICVHESPWQYHFNPDNYVLLEDVLKEQKLDALLSRSFVKLSRKLSIDQFSNVIAEGKMTLNGFLKLIV